MDFDIDQGIVDPAWVDQQLTATDLTLREKQLRERWVLEYLFDRDEIAATLRCGYPHNLARDYAAKYINDPYVNVLIKQKLESDKIDSAAPNEIEERKKMILHGLMKEATFHGHNASHSARVAALSKLSTIHGMEAAIKIDKNITHRGGVMLIPAKQIKMDDWEKEAIEGQCKLIDDARK